MHPDTVAATQDQRTEVECTAVGRDLAALDVLRSELDGVEAALSRIDAGSYGRCISCGVVIGADRLAADPISPHCADHDR